MFARVSFAASLTSERYGCNVRAGRMSGLLRGRWMTPLEWMIAIFIVTFLEFLH
jgi:hypothetical protein